MKNQFINPSKFLPSVIETKLESYFDLSYYLKQNLAELFL